MTSAAQIAANIVNAQPSTGPTTFEGKTRSAENARKFGFYSKQAVLLKIGGFGNCSKGKAASSGAAFFAPVCRQVRTPDESGV